MRGSVGSQKWIARTAGGLVVGLLLAAPGLAAPPFEFPAAAAENPAVLAQALPGLAREVLAVYKDDDRPTYLDHRFRLEIVAGQPADALATLAYLRVTPEAAGDVSPQAGATRLLYEVFARARERADGPSFEAALEQTFRETLGRLDDPTSALVMRALGVDLPALEQGVKTALEPAKQGRLSLAEALALIRASQIEQTFRSFAPFAAAAIAEDDRRRYVIERDIAVRTPEGATSCVLVVRPRAAAGRLPALLSFTIYANSQDLLSEARRTASHGYAGVEALTRGKGCSPDAPVPYEHDGKDAAAVIDWIARQAWSDGRVGMFGGSYEGFTQWAAAKHRPKALKALMPSVAVAPGIDVPMDGNVFQTFVYPWVFYTTNGKALDDPTYNDRARWWRMNREWYASGRAYRALDEIDGTPNPIFERWLDHPAYDAYWQAMIPFRKEFAGIDIPVLSTTGYYDGAQLGAIHYVDEHHRHRPGAGHYLLIGPWDHIRGQRGTISRLGHPQTNLRGYDTDPVAQIDIGELRYQWFDFVFKGGPKPTLLKDKVNYQVMGANTWRHVPSLAAMGPETLRLHLAAARSGEDHRLSATRPPRASFVPQKIDLADRTDIERVFPGGGLVDREINRWNAVVFTSDPFPAAAEVSGLFSGRLEFVANKRDLDFAIELYELTARGDYVELSSYMARASYVRDRGRRQLLQPGRRQQLDFRSGRLTARRFEPGSRLVAVLRILKSPGAQVNFGSGKDVSDETRADAGAPLEVRWLGGSFLDIPVRPSLKQRFVEARPEGKGLRGLLSLTGTVIACAN